MLLQTNSYIVPKDKRGDHTLMLKRFRQTLLRLGCDHFECYEQVGTNWSTGDTTGRFVQIMRFRDRKHQMSVQSAERTDTTAQQVISEFCELINFPYQQQQGLFATGFYTAVLPVAGDSKLAGTLPDDEARMTDAELRGEEEDVELEEEFIDAAPSPLDSTTEKQQPASDDEAFSRG